MTKKIKWLASSIWGLTAVLAVVLFGIIILLLSFMAWFGYMGVQTGRITATFLLEKPSAVILAVCLISMVLGAVIMFIVQKLLISPIRQMTKAVQQLADGKFDTRISLGTFLRPREIITFSESFNKTAEQLSSVEILRSDFISNFSHEFNPPSTLLSALPSF